MASIAFFETKPWERAYLSKKLKGNKLFFYPEPLSSKHISQLKNVDLLSVFIYSKVTAQMLKSMPKLKLIATRSTGYDHIDCKACKKRKIKVCTVPFYGENTVAEHTFALILSLSRNIHKSYVRTLKDDYSIDGLTGFDLRGKILGIVGGGHIGMHVAKIAKGFGMDILVFDSSRQGFLAEVLGFRYASLSELLRHSDIVTLHVPYNEQTHHLINSKNISMMKKGAFLINTSRGGVVDTDALLLALEKNSIAGAGLDVIEGEDLIHEEKQLLSEKQSEVNMEKWKVILRDHKILHRENVVFTPHNAFNSKEALLRILDTTIENLTSGVKKSPKNSVV